MAFAAWISFGIKGSRLREKQPCYATKYESYRICLGAKARAGASVIFGTASSLEATVQDGRSFETLHAADPVNGELQ